MKKVKFEKGITLIALIITIIVLLILAAVTMGTMKESGIIGYAQDAKSEYTIAQEKEKIVLAYSEYQIQKTINADVEPDTLAVDEATIEPIGNFGWKVTYKDTGNVYGINSKGEYDEAITMIIEASEETGVSVDKFIIFEDKYAIKTNAKKANEPGYTKIPERYVFYNWAKVTDEEERKILELYNPTTPSTELVENKSNRMLVIDTNGDGNVIYTNYSGISDKYNNADNYVMGKYFATNEVVGDMTDEIHNFYAKICYNQNGENIYDKYSISYSSNMFKDGYYCFLWDFDGRGYYDPGIDESCIWCIANGLIEEDIPEEGTLYTFKNYIIDKHVYYTSPRYEADFE